ncbi:hypothetical protein M422DRAFT_275308 [Sphaerobolus stellatus SS14]|uniref:Uncharacterized protein n=1 Tax=Sphaerobolus stellatus (strain SS14) TaxID=990650 RepID=A0A0C9UFP1_SPHS4|nr:hypothetical protein M422DRAFT_275308 [Sphaerobolus stellatus SS14]
MRRIAQSTYDHYIKALGQYNLAVAEYQAASDAVDPSLIAKWKLMDTRPTQDSKGVWTSVDELKRDQMPTQTQILQQLHDSEMEEDITSLKKAAKLKNHSHGLAHFINAGLQLQQNQKDLRARIKGAPSNQDAKEHRQIHSAQLKLLRDITHWRTLQSRRFPAFAESDSLSAEAVDSDLDPQNEILGLPSDFEDEEERLELGLDSAVDIECQLRQGQAYDALEELRGKIRLERNMIDQKKVHARGTGANTRAETSIRSVTSAKQRAAQNYIDARQAMIVLGSRQRDKAFHSKLPDLDKNKDLWMKDPSKVLVLGDGTRQEPWIWHIGLQIHGESSENSMLEEDRVRWFKSRALMQRWREEIHMREADFKRIQRSYLRMVSAWNSIAHTVTSSTSDLSLLARRAYSLKMADYYGQRLDEAVKLGLEATTSKLANETNLSTPT